MTEQRQHGGNYVLTRALWVSRDVIAWNAFGSATYELHAGYDQALQVPNSAGIGYQLTWAGKASHDTFAKFPNIVGYDLWRIPQDALAAIPKLLKSELAIAAYDEHGDLNDATGLQLQGVLDAVYTYDGPLGVTYDGAGVPTLRVWAPTARRVALVRYAGPRSAEIAHEPLEYNAKSGVWSWVGSAECTYQYYQLEVEVFMRDSGRVETNFVTDPYSVSLSTNSQRSQFVDLYNDKSLQPAGWDTLEKPHLAHPTDISIYEMHVRDFSCNDASVPPEYRGKFKAFTLPDTHGMRHLLKLADAGLTHVHLLPIADFTKVDEDASRRVEPVIDAGLASDSAEQQAIIYKSRKQASFNWGYDPFHYGVPEGSYSTDPDGVSRIIELRELVVALNGHGLRVVMDVVYNHTYKAALTQWSVLDKIVPNYYYRYDNAGHIFKTSCCPDTAPEFTMMEKLMVDTLVHWAKAYKIDGFRFDLMNLHTVDNMVNIKRALTAVDPDIYTYGEGWDFGSAQAKGVLYAKHDTMRGKGIGVFNDRIRDAAHGGYSTDDPRIRHQGFINGLSYAWNGHYYDYRYQSDLHIEQNRLRVALAGSFDDFADEPLETINYISKHDNETLFDQNVLKLPYGTPMAERVRVQKLGLSLIMLSQGIPFFQMGSDMLRSKSLDRNSYYSGDWFNRVDFTYTHNNFGVGLPLASENERNYHILGPLLADRGLVPDSADIQNTAAYFQTLLKIRTSSPLFRLRTADQIRTKLRFYNTDNALDGWIMMHLNDAVGRPVDDLYKHIIVIFNAHVIEQSQCVPQLANCNFVPHPLLEDIGFSYSTSGTFTVPPRTTAVLVALKSSAL